MHRTTAGVRSRLLASWFCTCSEEIISTSIAFLSLTQQRQSTEGNTQTLSVSGGSLYVTVTHRSPQQAWDKERRWREHQEVHASRLWVDQWWHECQRSSSVMPLYDCLPAQTALNTHRHVLLQSSNYKTQVSTSRYNTSRTRKLHTVLHTTAISKATWLHVHEQ